jgi:hypothetical protein
MMEFILESSSDSCFIISLSPHHSQCVSYQCLILLLSLYFQNSSFFHPEEESVSHFLSYLIVYRSCLLAGSIVNFKSLCDVTEHKVISIIHISHKNLKECKIAKFRKIIWKLLAFII